jgi:ornithine decarboxylase
MAVDVLVYAHQLGLVSHGVSFHVGSQMTKLDAWDAALADARRVFDKLAQQGIELKMVNMGGGFPTKYLKDVPTAQAYGKAIFGALCAGTSAISIPRRSSSRAAAWSAMPA